MFTSAQFYSIAHTINHRDCALINLSCFVSKAEPYHHEARNITLGQKLLSMGTSLDCRTMVLSTTAKFYGTFSAIYQKYEFVNLFCFGSKVGPRQNIRLG